MGLPITARQPLGGFSSNLGHVCSSPGEKNLNMVSIVFQRGVLSVRIIT